MNLVVKRAVWIRSPQCNLAGLFFFIKKKNKETRRIFGERGPPLAPNIVSHNVSESKTKFEDPFLVPQQYTANFKADRMDGR